MMRWFVQCFVLALALLCVLPAHAQEPQVSVEFEREPVLVGQPFVVRVKVLVPTFMPHPPVWPTFEAAGLIVRLPSRSTSPVSERIGGQTWSGIRRTYRIYPTRVGTIAIPPQSIVITYKHPETNEDVKLVQDMPEVFVVGSVPEGARGMDPLILANDVSIAQDWEAPEGTLKVGDAIVRKLNAEIQAASPLFIPPLLETADAKAPVPETDRDAPPIEMAQLGVYPKEPSVSEKLERGIMSGTRHDQATYLPQSGGTAVLPDITLTWFNLKSNTLETITLPGRSFEVEGSPAPAPKLDRDTVLQIIAGLLVAAAVVWLYRRYAQSQIAAYRQKRDKAYLASARYAHRQARYAAHTKNLNMVYTELDRLAACDDGHRDAAVAHALRELTRTIYDDQADKSQEAHHWDNLLKALEWSKPRYYGGNKRKSSAPLPRLNPFTDQCGNA